MRTGAEQFILKDFSFYDAMVMPVVGLEALAIYEVLRRFVWRSNKGRAESRTAYRNGHLSVIVRQAEIATMTGLSERTVRTGVRKLESLGWIRSHRLKTSRQLLYQLGYRADTDGTEVFYADSQLRRLWNMLEMTCEHLDVEKVTALHWELRQFIAQECLGKGQPANAAGSTGKSCRYTDCLPAGAAGLKIGESSGGEIDEGEYIGRAAPAEKDQPIESIPQGPPHCSSTFESNVQNDEEDQDEDKKEQPATFALDNGEISGHGDMEESRPREERFAGAEEAIARASAKTTKTVEDNLARAETRERRAKNLKGSPLSPNDHKEVKRLWGVWRELFDEFDSRLHVAPWTKGKDGRSLGQVLRLVGMYDGDIVENTFRYVFNQWEEVSARYFKNSPHGPQTPTVNFIAGCHESLCREAQVWARYRAVLEEWEQWQRDNPGNYRPPSDLKERYTAARAALSGAGK